MTVRITTLLWLASFLVLLVSIIVSLYPTHHFSINAVISFNDDTSRSKLTFAWKIINKGRFEDFIDIIQELTRRMSRHHPSHKRIKKSEKYCDDLAWKSKLITSYRVSFFFFTNIWIYCLYWKDGIQGGGPKPYLHELLHYSWRALVNPTSRDT